MPDIFNINFTQLSFKNATFLFAFFFWVKRNFGKFDYDGPSHLSFDKDNYCRILS